MPRPPGARTDHVYSGRSCFPKARLTGAQRDEITRRLADGEKPADLALEYGVSAKTIREYR
jgi:uncharacterized protein (DUF433 family)